MTKIVSNYKDYYDYLAVYGIEKDLIFYRKTRVLDHYDLLDVVDKKDGALHDRLKDILEFTVSFGGRSNPSLTGRYIDAGLFKSEITGGRKDQYDYRSQVMDIMRARFGGLKNHESEYSHDFSLTLYAFIICGKFYPVFEYDLSGPREFHQIKRVGNDELLDGGFYEEIKAISKTCFNGELPFGNPGIDDGFLRLYKNTKDRDYSAINKFFNSPVVNIGLEYYSCDGSDLYYVTSPVLFPFKKYLPDSQTIWTELNTWLSNQKNANYKKDEIMSDVIKLEKKGFDRKTSFRKEKSSKK
jgi:hypothetical protein